MWREEYDKIEESDQELRRRVRATEEQDSLLSQELEILNSAEKSELNVEFLLQKVRKLCEEKKSLVFVIRSELRSRLKERSAATEAVKLIKATMDSHLKKMENEKRDVEVILEKEIDRRSSEWASTLEKTRSGQKRLKARVRDLAEKNVSLQRKVSSLNNQNIEMKYQVAELNEMKTELANAKKVLMHLRECLSESFNKIQRLEDERDSIKRTYQEKEKEFSSATFKKIEQVEDELNLIKKKYKEKERENYELQKSRVRLQKLCSDQERILGVEQAVAQDLEKCKSEGDALRRENGILLQRLQSLEKDHSLWYELDRLKVDELQRLPLFDDNIQLPLQDNNAVT